MSKKTEYNVTVLRREEFTTYPKLGQAVIVLSVTYIAEGLPPHAIIIPKAEHTPVKEKELIRKDIEARFKEKPETFKV